jgi:hypothetical protein
MGLAGLIERTAPAVVVEKFFEGRADDVELEAIFGGLGLHGKN